MKTYSMKAVRALAILIVATMAVSAVPMVAGEGSVDNVSAAADEGYVRVGWLSTIVNWNPLAIEMVEDYVACYLIHSSLFTYDEDWGGPVNDLATGYSQVTHPNGSMTTTITITHNAYFRNNANLADTTHPLTADDVVYTLHNLMKMNEGGAFDWYLQEISDIKKIDTWTISMWCPYAKATLIDDITSLPILPKYIWQNIGNPLANVQPTALVGSGPFVYESMLKDYWYKFKRAPNYHGQADYGAARTVNLGVAGIIYTVYSDMPGMCLSMNKGDEDTVIVTGDVYSFQKTLGHGASVNIIKAAVQENGICDIAINAIPDVFTGGSYGTGKAVLLDPFVREAIMMTLNKPYINVTLLGGLAGQLGDSVVDPGFWHKTIENPLPYDPAGAKAMLMSRGWVDNDADGYLEATSSVHGVNMSYFPAGTELQGIRCQAPDTDPTYGNIAIAWQGWAKQAGIGFVSTVESEITMINQAWYQADYDIWVWHWGWGPEPLGGALSCWLTETLEGGGDNCQMPMGEWWAHSGNYTTCPYINASMILEFDMDDDGFNGFSSFDQNFSRAMHTLDINDRKEIVDDLQQVVYDSYSESPPFYDLGLYAYTDYRFEGWGDWEAHNGLNPASDLLWLWFGLEPVVNRAPKFDVPPEEDYTTYVGGSEDFVVAVSDFEGDDLWVNYTFGDGTAVEPHHLTGDTTKITYVNTSHAYTTASTSVKFSVSLTDMFEGRVYYRNATIEVQETFNAPPQFTAPITYSIDPPVYIETPITWSVSAKDLDGGTFATNLKFTWDWGDFTYTVDTKTGILDNVPVTSTQVHTWTVADTYTVKVSVYDTGLEIGAHNVSLNVEYEVLVNEPPEYPTIEDISGIPGGDTICVATSSDSDADDLTFTWEWDDGTFDVETLTSTYADETLTSEMIHVWAVADTYEVTVWVDDGLPGHNVSSSVDAEIGEGNVKPASFRLVPIPSPVYVGVMTTYNASAVDANGDALIITVDFEDGNISSGVTAGGVTTRQFIDFVHEYEETGTYEVTVWADDGEFNESSTFYVTVSVPTGNLPPTMQLPDSFTAKYNESREYAPFVDDADDDELSVWFNWGDETAMSLGDPEDGYNATHTYRSLGTFTMTVYVDDGNDHNVSKTSNVFVVEGNYRTAVESITVQPDQDEYETGQTITFVVRVSDLEGDESVVTIEFGDGTTDEETIDLAPTVDYDVTFTHTYDEAGDYDVNATADDGMDHSNPALLKQTVELTVVSAGFNLMLVAGIAIILIAVVVVAAMLLMKKKKKKGGTPETLGGMEGMAPAEEPPPQP